MVRRRHRELETVSFMSFMRDRFSGVVLLSHRGRTVLSRSYGMADRERGIRNHEGIAVNLSSAIQPLYQWPCCSWCSRSSEPVGHGGHPPDGLRQRDRRFHSRDEVHEYHEQWTRQAAAGGRPWRQRHDGDVVRPEVLRLCDGEADDGRLGQVVEQRAAVAVGEDFVVDHTPYATLLGDHATPLDEALAATLK